MPRSQSTAINRAAPAARLHFARQSHRAAKQQQFLAQDGLAGVGVRNDLKGAPAQNLVRQGTQ
jgi:hypothetical protein